MAGTLSNWIFALAMPQFTSASLSRLLLNVDRNVLVDAIDLADMWDLFGSFERATLIELGEAQNLAANIETFNLDTMSRGTFDFDAMLGVLSIALPLLPPRLRVVVLPIVGVLFGLEALGVQFKDVIRAVAPQNIDTSALRIIASELDNLANLALTISVPRDMVQRRSRVISGIRSAAGAIRAFASGLATV